MAENPDVPDLERCKELAEAGYPQRGDEWSSWWWMVFDDDPAEPPELCDLNPCGELAEGATATVVFAPTIGQMMAFCRERGWRPIIGDVRGERWWANFVGSAFSLISGREGNSPANALASAIAAAMRAEKGGGG